MQQFLMAIGVIASVAASGVALGDREDMFGNHPPQGPPLVDFEKDEGSTWHGDYARLDLMSAMGGRYNWSELSLTADRDVWYGLDGSAWRPLPSGEPKSIASEAALAGDSLSFCGGPGTVHVSVYYPRTTTLLFETRFDSLPSCEGGPDVR